MDFALLTSAARIHPQFAAACVNFDDSALRCVRSDMSALFGSDAGGNFPIFSITNEAAVVFWQPHAGPTCDRR